MTIYHSKESTIFTITPQPVVEQVLLKDVGCEVGLDANQQIATLHFTRDDFERRKKLTIYGGTYFKILRKQPTAVYTYYNAVFSFAKGKLASIEFKHQAETVKEMRMELLLPPIEYDEETEMISLALDEDVALTDPRAAAFAWHNLKSQADNFYFDGKLVVYLDGELFFEESTTDVCGLLKALKTYKEYDGVNDILFLDSTVTFLITQSDAGMHLYTHDEVQQWSKLIPPALFDKAIEDVYTAFCTLLIDTKLPLSQREDVLALSMV